VCCYRKRKKNDEKEREGRIDHIFRSYAISPYQVGQRKSISPESWNVFQFDVKRPVSRLLSVSLSTTQEKRRKCE
jgi:hypothetical protein